MNKRKKTTIILCSVAIALVLLVAGMLIWFFSPGVHNLFHLTNINVDQSGYLVSKEGQMQIIRETSFCAKGCAAASTEDGTQAKKNAFDHIQIGDFPSITAEDKASAYTVNYDDGIMMIAVTTADVSKQNDQSSSTSTEAILYYRVFFDTDTNEILMSSYERIQNGETDRYYFFTTNDEEVIKSTLARCPY